MPWKRIGTPFPGDFKKFMAEYGAGTIDGHLSVLLAEPRGGFDGGPAYMGMAEELRNAEETWRAPQATTRHLGPGLQRGHAVLVGRRRRA
ncbi:hypothetical protein [Streptomyces brasiliensis]|uniref:Uncharacterized protein n=1 Tax=Streptomyces brasiliensis TaxID=1954 RepID=A0A917LDW7_9ACTN|nr:hypothetical protein [Streptomyces brasiliensis]GGJ56432.1 hypothetical protein GCM10010121_078790 [Streptomyces brasiliensis]